MPKMQSDRDIKPPQKIACKCNRNSVTYPCRNAPRLYKMTATHWEIMVKSCVNLTKMQKIGKIPLTFLRIWSNIIYG